MGKLSRNFSKMRHRYLHRLESRIAIHEEFYNPLSDEELRKVKELVRIEIEREYRSRVKKKLAIAVLLFVGIAMGLFTLLKV